LSYCFEEIFAEKMRALAERERPRDLYDVVHLYRHVEIRPDRGVVLKTLQKKCAFKGIPVPTIESLPRVEAWLFLSIWAARSPPVRSSERWRIRQRREKMPTLPDVRHQIARLVLERLRI